MNRDDVRSRSQLLAEVLLDDLEHLAGLCVARMQELVPPYAKIRRDDLTPIVRANARGVLEAVCDPDADRARAEDVHRASGRSAARARITGNDLLQGWRIGLEVVREQARAVPDELRIGEGDLLEFMEATLHWGDVGMRASALAYHEAEVREIGRLATEQAALRRVATMVARASTAEEVFAAVAEEVGLLLRADVTVIHRYEPAEHATVVAIWGKPTDAFWVGRLWKTGARTVAGAVRRTEGPVRFDAYATVGGSITAEARKAGMRSGIGSPIFVDGRLWGVIVASTSRTELLPAGAESRLAEFTELVATAISNIQARLGLAASRARIVAAADEERRRVARDLHDGAQQRLVHTVVMLKLARRALEDRRDPAALLAEALQHAQAATDELRELAHGILPSILTNGGLGAGVSALASRMSVPVEVDISVDRLPRAVEATAYFIVAEALTNVTKHADASRAAVRARVEHSALQLEVCDDGVGGAHPDGPGLVGLGDRLAALDGTIRIESRGGRGTAIAVSIPILVAAPGIPI